MKRPKRRRSGIICRTMTPPNADQHNPDPNYCAALIARCGLTQDEIAKRLAVGKRALRAYKDAGPNGLKMPYLVQFGLECLPKAKT
jgi:hypothetical protein